MSRSAILLSGAVLASAFLPAFLPMGALSADSDGVGDGQPTVTLSLRKATAQEPGTELRHRGAFRISRTGSTDFPLTVRVLVTGSAVPGQDYAALVPSYQIPQGAESLTVEVQVIDDTVHEGNESVRMELLPGDYQMGSTDGVVVTVQDDDPPVGGGH